MLSQRLIGGLGIAAFLLLPTMVEARCSRDPGVTCQDDVNNAMTSLRHSGSLNDAVRNVGRVGRAMEDCVTCAMRDVEQGVDNAVTGTNTSTNTNTDSND